MEEFYAKVVLKTLNPIENPDNLIVSLDTIEFQMPELLRLDFSKSKRYIHKIEDGTCEIELYGYDFDYDTYEMDYEKLRLKPWDFDADYFDSILNGYLKVTEILVDCTDSSNPERAIPLHLEKVQLVFSTEIGETLIDFTSKITSGCIEKLAYSEPPDLHRIAETVSYYGEYSGFCKSFANALLESIRTDDEKPERLGRYALKAIKETNFDDFLIAICGWSLESLMKQAHIIPDNESMFHDEIIDATLVGVWDEEVREELSCKVNTKTREIFDIEHDFDESKGKEDFDNFEEFVSIDGIEFPVVPKDEFESGQKLAFWYGEDE